MAMRLAVMYTPYATYSREQTGNVITLTQFEEGNILTETCNDAEICDKPDNKSIMMSKQDMENIDSGDESDHYLISTERLEDICDGSQSHQNVKHVSPSTKIVLWYLRRYSRASKRISCVRTQYKEDNIFI